LKSNKRINPYLLLLIGILAVSTAAIFIRLILLEASALVIAAYRLALSALISGFLLLISHKRNHDLLCRKDFSLLVLSGVFLAAHFVAWITSLEFISVSSSVILVTTTPLWVALLSPIVLKEKVGSRFYWGMAVAIIGGVIIAFSGPCHLSTTGLSCSGSVFDRNSQTLWGMALALLGAWMASGYMLIGRKMRLKMDNLSYTTSVYTVSAIVLILALILRGEKVLGYSPQTYALFVALAIIPQLLGHSVLNYSLEVLPATIVSMALLGEPVGSTILAVIFLNEIPSTLEIIGGIFILLGIGISVLPERKPNVV
jgi:drug/metabolite transporter (DMT)-like permease